MQMKWMDPSTLASTSRSSVLLERGSFQRNQTASGCDIGWDGVTKPARREP